MSADTVSEASFSDDSVRTKLLDVENDLQSYYRVALPAGPDDYITVEAVFVSRVQQHESGRYDYYYELIFAPSDPKDKSKLLEIGLNLQSDPSFLADLLQGQQSYTTLESAETGLAYNVGFKPAAGVLMNIFDEPVKSQAIVELRNRAGEKIGSLPVSLHRPRNHA